MKRLRTEPLSFRSRSADSVLIGDMMSFPIEGFGPGVQFPDAAEDPGSNGIPRLLQALCTHDMGDLPQGRHVFACACRCGGGGSRGVGDERSFGVGPAT